MITYRKVYPHVYQICEPFSIRVDIWVDRVLHLPFLQLWPKGILHFERGYISDGPSGPTFDTKNAMRAAFVHDALYRFMRMGLLPQSHRKYADQLLYKILREDGMSMLRAGLWYNALRLFSAKSAKYNKDDAIQQFIRIPKE